jgi:hypothetical protein
MKTRLLTAIALAAVLVALPTAALGGDARREANSATFADSTGEDASAPDITSVAVSNDDAGMISFQINVSNRPSFTQDMFFVMFLNTDQNPGTGAADFLGAEYGIELDPGAITLFQWNGSDFVPAPSQASLTYSYGTGGPTIRVKASDLGKAKGFDFSVIAVSGVSIDPTGNFDTTNAHRDPAPDFGHGQFRYQVLTKLVLSVTAFTTGPKPAKAGRSFSASLAATENDTGGPAAAGSVGCAATIAFKRIVAVTHVVTNGVANCVWRIPAAAKGKILRGTITVTVRGVHATRSFSSRIS